jgi:DNA-binding NtrC family response regulator
VAEGSEQALELPEDRRLKAVIIDLNMSDASGYGLCRMVKRKWPKMVVVSTSEDANRDCLNRAHSAGAVEILTKPINLVWPSPTIKNALQSERRRDKNA